VALLAALGSTVPLAAQSTYTPWQFTTVAGQSGVRPGSQDGPGATALFSGPQGIAVDAVGNLYVADTGNQTIRKISPSGDVSTLAGTAGVGGHADGLGPAATFSAPAGIAVDSAGNVYVADAGNSLIRKISPAGAVTTMAGGAARYADGTGPAAGFDAPDGVAVDAAGNLYVADTLDNAIRKITPDGAVTTLAGNPNLFVPSGEDGTGPVARFNDPFGVAVDGTGNLYVADTANETIRRISPAGAVTTVAGAAGNAGTLDAAGGAARFNAPTGVAVDRQGNLYVCDSDNGTLRRIDPGGGVTTLAGGPGQVYLGAGGIGPAARFGNLTAVAVGPDGTVYLADSQDNTIRRGVPAGPSTATVLIGNLTQVYQGYVQPVSVTTIPAGLQTSVTYSGPLNSSNPPNGEGTYGVFAIITDPNYTGYANALLTVEPGPAAQPAFSVRHSVPGGSALWGITYGPSGLVAVGTAGTILTSPDGSTWTARASGTNAWLVGVAFGGNQYVAVGDTGTVLVSPDGATWTPVAQSATSERLNNVTFGAGAYVAVGEGGTIITSPDARTWTARASGVTGWLRGLAWVDKYDFSVNILPRVFPAGFIATGQGGAILASPDGIIWSNAGVGNGLAPWVAGQNIEAIASTTDQLIGVGDNGALAFSEVKLDVFSPYEDLYTASFFAPVTYRAVVKGPGGIFAAGDSGTILMANQAFAGTPWFQVPSGTSSDLAGGLAIGSSVYFVGANETIVQVSTPSDSRLVNLSCRTQVGTGDNVLIAGFVLAGGSSNGATPMLIRGSGPALAAFDVPGVLPDPDLDLYGTASGSTLLASNTGWGGSPAVVSAAAAAGAFPWSDPSSHDDALLDILPAGSYTANITGQSGDTGIALAEIYDATPSGASTPDSPRLTNLAARAQVGTGSAVLIAGFVVGGTTAKQILIRASGPALVPFGVAGALPDPVLQVFDSASLSPYPLASNTGWSGEPGIASTAALVGAFPWTAASGDSALLLTLYPGAYTAQVAGAAGDSGVALIEVYEVP
jgi:sugar lactone lactonase YvrE